MTQMLRPRGCALHAHVPARCRPPLQGATEHHMCALMPMHVQEHQATMARWVGHQSPCGLAARPR